MDISINVSTKPFVKKPISKPVVDNITVGKKNISYPSAQFQWDSSRKNTKNVFNKRAQPLRNTEVTPRTENVTIENNETLNIQSQEDGKFRFNKKVSRANAKSQDKNYRNNSFLSFDQNMGANGENNQDGKVKHRNTKNIPSNGPKFFPLFSKQSGTPKININNSEKVQPSIENVFSASRKTFSEINIHQHTITNLSRLSITTLTAVQEKAIPIILSGNNTFIRSQTGSGKTLAYAVPIVDSLRSIEPHISRKDGVQAIIVLPTRELAQQTYELFMSLVEPFRWIVPGKLCGGENRNSEKARIRKGINILIGTPGRLLDHVLHTTSLKLDKVRCLVLDEADRLLDMGFQKDISSLINLVNEARNFDYDPIAMMKGSKNSEELIEESTETSQEIPLCDITSKKMQTILLSATLTSNVKDLAAFTLKDYVYIDPLSVDDTISSIPDAGRVDVAVPTSVRQKFIVTDIKTKLVVLSSLIVSRVKEDRCKMFIFMESRQMVEFHEALFKKCLLTRTAKKKGNSEVMIDVPDSGSDCDAEEEVLDIQIFKLHGSMVQKERVEVFKSFKNAQRGILLCTDVVARGVDVPHADYVIQYTVPLQTDVYIHRVGRTGRVGKKGKALIFLTESELDYVNHLRTEKKLKLTRETQENALKHLIPFMQYLSPTNSQVAAEALQKRFENAVLHNKELNTAACFAYSSWSRFYSSYPSDLRPFFDIKKAHIGHYVTSFALRISPQEVNKVIRAALNTVTEKKFNKKLSNNPSEESTNTAPRPKKRSRARELVISEYDSGIASMKKKNKLH